MKKSVTVAIATIALALLFFASAVIGASTLSPGDVLFGIVHPRSSELAARIMWEIRLPRVFCALVVGGALGSAGYVLQTLVRNPIVEPYTTGVSAGASVAAAIGVALQAPAGLIPAMGTASGLLASIVVIALSVTAGRIDSLRLVLAGTFVTAFLSAIVSIVILRVHNYEAALSLLHWLAGSLAGHGWSDIAIALPYALAGFAMLAFAVPGLGALRLGEERAASIGAPIAQTQWLTVVGSTLLTASAVSLAGIIAFVGLLAPHAARRFIGGDVRFSLPMSAICGAILVTVADVVARVATQPVELPIGALLSLFGVPALFLIVRREHRIARVRPATSGAATRIPRLEKSSA